MFEIELLNFLLVNTIFTFLHMQSWYRCIGNESSISQCNGRTGSPAQVCGHGFDAGVECNAPVRSKDLAVS